MVEHPEVGAAARRQVTLENPTAEDVIVKHSVDNRRNFSVTPAQLALAAYSSGEATIVYTPSSVDQEERGEVTFSSASLGEWSFKLAGRGTMPGVMEPVPVTAPAGQQMSASITFRNKWGLVQIAGRTE